MHPFVPMSIYPFEFVWIRTSIYMYGFQNDFEQRVSIIGKTAIWKFHSSRSKVKVLLARQVVPGQPSSP